MENLYKVYGELMIQKEIIDGRILEVKRAIAELLNKPTEKPVDNQVDNQKEKEDKKEEKK